MSVAHQQHDVKKMSAAVASCDPTVAAEALAVARRVVDGCSIRVLRAPQHWLQHQRNKHDVHLVCTACRTFKAFVVTSLRQFEAASRPSKLKVARNQRVTAMTKVLAQNGNVAEACVAASKRVVSLGPPLGRRPDDAERSAGACKISYDAHTDRVYCFPFNTAKSGATERVIAKAKACVGTACLPILMTGTLVEFYGGVVFKCWGCDAPSVVDPTKDAFNDMLCDDVCHQRNAEPLPSCGRCGAVRHSSGNDGKRSWASTFCIRHPDAVDKSLSVVETWFCPTEQCGWVNRCSIWTHAGLKAAMQRMQKKRRM